MRTTNTLTANMHTFEATLFKYKASTAVDETGLSKDFTVLYRNKQTPLLSMF